ncbi:hypothetical protein RB195_023925 [Necator americanus]|uniref:Serpin domain-containing protein n=1 Tax=Necator americanus TaxID=51031 RepID=A0ABR1EL54_NECAM
MTVAKGKGKLQTQFFTSATQRSYENRYHYKTINKKQTELRGQAVPVRKRYSSLHQPYCREDPARYPSSLRDLFSLLKDGPGAQTTLPFGLKAIPLILGYLISGRSGEELVNSKNSVEVAQTIALEDTDNDFTQTWEQFCEFEKTGVKEFLGPITEELKQTNAEVWKAFEETIENKEDG